MSNNKPEQIVELLHNTYAHHLDDMLKRSKHLNGDKVQDAHNRLKSMIQAKIDDWCKFVEATNPETSASSKDEGQKDKKKKKKKQKQGKTT